MGDHSVSTNIFILNTHWDKSECKKQFGSEAFVIKDVQEIQNWDVQGTKYYLYKSQDYLYYMQIYVFEEIL